MLTDQFELKIVEKDWTCEQGHRWKAADPFIVQFYQGPNEKKFTTGPLCLACVAQFLNINFEAKEV